MSVVNRRLRQTVTKSIRFSHIVLRVDDLRFVPFRLLLLTRLPKLTSDE
jgi:hypothetical protein